MLTEPTQAVPAGTALSERPPKIFQPWRLRGVSFQNRIWVSPMCQYSARDGHMTSYHFAHLASFILRGPSLTFVEATAVTPQGRISPFDCGLWEDSQITGLVRIVEFAHEYKQKIGIQLAHAGRKASTRPPWQLARGRASQVTPADEGGWPDSVSGPDGVSWGEGHADPKAMSRDDIHGVVDGFANSAKRAVKAGFDVIEIHAAHGYLLSSFLSSTSNTRDDEYGGSFENRCRLPLLVVDAVRRNISPEMPLSFRISVTEWLPPSESNAWGVDNTVDLAMMLFQHGVDMLIISSGGNSARQKIPRTIEYQTSLAAQVRKRLHERGCGIAIGAVGRVKEPEQAKVLLDPASSQKVPGPAGDVVLLGRQFLKEPGWVLRAANDLGVRVQWPLQYQLGRYGLETKL